MRTKSHRRSTSVAFFVLTLVVSAGMLPSHARAAEPGPVVRPVLGPEILSYDVTVFGAHAGVATLSASRGKELLYYRAELSSAGLFHSIYPIDNLAVSYIDRETFLPRRYTMETKERGLLVQYLLDFDQEKKRIRRLKWKRRGGPENKGRWHDFVVKGYGSVQDMLSSLMYLRSRRLAEDEQGIFYGMSGNFIYQIRYRVVDQGSTYTRLGSRQGIAVRAAVRRWDWRKRRPAGPGRGQKKGWSREVLMWFSNDASHMPLSIEVTLFVGAVKIILSKVETP
jgi:Protein of unknown function (DUF3108)